VYVPPHVGPDGREVAGHWDEWRFLEPEEQELVERFEADGRQRRRHGPRTRR
jgi:hypothetical protein